MSPSSVLFAGTYTRRPGTGQPSGSDGIYTLRFDSDSGTLTQLAVTTGIVDPSFITLSPDQACLYAVSEVDDGQVVAYHIEAHSGALVELNRQSTGGISPAYIATDREGGCVMAANYGRGQQIAAFPIGADGSLGPASSALRYSGSGPVIERQEAPHAHCILPDPTNRYALAVDLGTDQVVIYRLDGANGHLTPHAVYAAAPGSGPRHLVFHPNGRFAYLIHELDSTLVTLAWDAENGQLQTLQTVSTLPDAARFERNSPSEAHLTPDGAYLYAANRFHDSLAVYAVNPETGLLAPRGHQLTGGKTPRGFAIDPAGRFVLVGHQDSDDIAVFRIQPDGSLTASGTRFTLPAPVCLKFLRAE